MVFACGYEGGPEAETYTCDTPICEEHAIQGRPTFFCGADINECVAVPDYCPEHRDSNALAKPIYPWDANRERMAVRLKIALRIEKRQAARWLD